MLLQDRLKKGKERLDQALESLTLLCEPVEAPKGELEHIHYFCGNTEIPSDLEGSRAASGSSLQGDASRWCAHMRTSPTSWNLLATPPADITRIKQQLDHFLNVREIIRKASGETLDLKAYEADMRHLLDTYIEADEPRKISPFDNMAPAGADR